MAVSGPSIQLQTLDPFGQIELKQVIEGHKVSIPSKDIHFLVQHIHALPVSGTRLLPNNESMGVIIDDLLFQLLMSRLLVPDCLQGFQHRLCCWRELSFLFRLVLIFLK